MSSILVPSFGKVVGIDIARLDARKTKNLDFEEFNDGNAHNTPQGALHVSTGQLETTGLDTCVGIGIIDQGKCILAHIDALANHWDLTELLRKRANPETAKVHLFNYLPPTGEPEDYLFHRARTVVAVSLQKLGLLEQAESHSVSLFDKVGVSPDGISIQDPSQSRTVHTSTKLKAFDGPV